MSELTNQQLFENLDLLIQKYIEDNEDTPDEKKYTIQIKGSNLQSVELVVWEYDFDKPTLRDLKAIDLDTIKRSFKGDVTRVRTATTAQLLRFKVPDGALVYNTDASKLQVFINGVWV